MNMTQTLVMKPELNPQSVHSKITLQFVKKIQNPRPKQILPQITRDIAGKTLLFPIWDPVVSPLLVANLKRIRY